ncbi:MAG TPA: hypothetical protein VF461_07035 [Gemmatimonadaceae bacterium]
MRITRHALLIAFPLLLVGCKGTESIQGTPSELTSFRTLSSMQPFITRSLTPRTAQEQFGTPNAQTSTGEIVLVYNVEDSKKVSLGFPSLDGQILFARLSDKSGASTDLQILP